MSYLTSTQADLRYLRVAIGGTLSGLLIVPTAVDDDAISPPGAIVNRQYIRDNVPTLAITDLRYARLTGATFTGPVQLSGSLPTDPTSAIDKGYLDYTISTMDPTLTVLAPNQDGEIEWAPEHFGVYRINMTSNVVLRAPVHRGGATYRLIVAQPDPQLDPRRTLTFATDDFSWPSGLPPSLTPTAGAIDVFTFVSNGLKLLGSGQTDYI
jgi:hypothetical protein